jgi:hypothetical protein
LLTDQLLRDESGKMRRTQLRDERIGGAKAAVS